MEIRITAKECCGGICSIDDAKGGNLQEETECCHVEDHECCRNDWADDD